MVTEQQLSMSNAVTQALFGGAMSTSIPPHYADVSKIREIPDNQEVFAQAETDRSVIIELLELETDIPATYSTPASYHFSQLANDSNAVSHTLSHTSSLPITEVPFLNNYDSNISITIAFGPHVVAKFRDDNSRANTVNVYLACIRIPRSTTDLLIVFNDPVSLHPQGSSARAGAVVATDADPYDADTRSTPLKIAMNNLKVHDWSLLC